MSRCAYVVIRYTITITAGVRLHRGARGSSHFSACGVPVREAERGAGFTVWWQKRYGRGKGVNSTISWSETVTVSLRFATRYRLNRRIWGGLKGLPVWLLERYPEECTLVCATNLENTTVAKLFVGRRVGWKEELWTQGKRSSTCY